MNHWKFTTILHLPVSQGDYENKSPGDTKEEPKYITFLLKIWKTNIYHFNSLKKTKTI